MRSFAPRSLAPALALGLDLLLEDPVTFSAQFHDTSERLVDWALS